MTALPEILVSRGDDERDEIRRTFEGGSPVVCFANDYNGDPTSKHHIMRALAAYTDVLWVESAGMRRPNLSSPLDWRRIAARVQRSAAGVRNETGRLHVVSPLSIPLPGRRLATSVNRRLYRRAIGMALAQLGHRQPPLLWVYTPTVAPYLASLPRAGLVYHCVDRWWAFSDYDADVMRDCHAQLCRQADVVFASAGELLADCARHTDRAHLVRHGVEWAHFAKAALAPPPRPADIADLQGPIIGFFGLIHEWVDQNVICRIAESCPEATVVLIGRVQVDHARLRGVPNIRLLGQRAYEDLPAYAAAFDVALVPFVRNDLTAAVNPIKLREYLCAGLPVVATALPEVRLLRDRPQLRLAETPEQFVAATRELLAGGRDPGARRAAAEAERRESWDGRCAEMARLVRRHLPAARS
jgi:glycosyltransferase involved in cell wall biosynthesis